MFWALCGIHDQTFFADQSRFKADAPFFTPTFHVWHRYAKGMYSIIVINALLKRYLFQYIPSLLPSYETTNINICVCFVFVEFISSFLSIIIILTSSEIRMATSSPLLADLKAGCCSSASVEVRLLRFGGGA